MERLGMVQYPLVNVYSLLLKMAIEIVWNSWFTPQKWWFSIVFCMFTRGYTVEDGDHPIKLSNDHREDFCMAKGRKDDTHTSRSVTTGWWFGTFYIFPYIGNNHPNWLSYFSEGFKPPTSYTWLLWAVKKCIDAMTKNFVTWSIARSEV